MATQKVKNIVYLCVACFKLDKAKQEVILVPKGAEVVSVNLEIIEPLTNPGAQISIGLESDHDYFISRASAHDKGFHQSDVYWSVQSAQKIQASVNGPEAKANALAKLRVQYFLPSEISIEV